jgi:uncharacterized protein HemX
MHSFLGGALIGLTIDLPFVAGIDITDAGLQSGLLLWGALALGVAARHFVSCQVGRARRRENVLRN